MQPVIVRGGGRKGVICHGQGTSILSRGGGGVSINNSNNVYSSCVQEFFIIRLL